MVTQSIKSSLCGTFLLGMLSICRRASLLSDGFGNHHYWFISFEKTALLTLSIFCLAIPSIDESLPFSFDNSISFLHFCDDRQKNRPLVKLLLDRVSRNESLSESRLLSTRVIRLCEQIKKRESAHQIRLTGMSTRQVRATRFKIHNS